MSNVPSSIKLHQKSKVLSLHYADGREANLSCEYLRVHSPSAEVKGHGPGQEVLQVGKADVNIKAVNPVGNYAILLVFDDGHDTGIFSWDYLVELTENYDNNWQHYLDRLLQAGESRDPSTQVLSL